MIGCLCLRQIQRQRLTTEMRQSVRLSQSLLLLELQTNERLHPEGNCPNCERKLTAIEVIKGFRNNDVNDFTTGCPRCGKRFEPKLVKIGMSGAMEIEYPFFCKYQALARIRRHFGKNPDEIAREFPGEYRSLIIHCGNLQKAFAEIGLSYVFPEISGWQAKIAPFLGRIPDTKIAKAVGVKVEEVRKIRKKSGIPTYSIQQGIHEAVG